jgi:hypothetical protein
VGSHSVGGIAGDQKIIRQGLALAETQGVGLPCPKQ